MEMNFCRRCGTPLTHTERHIYTCANSHMLFANATPGVGVFLITEDNKVVLAIRGVEPEKGMLDTAGGFVDGEEPLEDALARELSEELGLDKSEYTSPRFLCSAIGHTLYEGETIPILSSFFWARLKVNRTLIPSDDVAGIRTLHINDIDFDELHDSDIRVGVTQLQKLDIFAR